MKKLYTRLISIDPTANPYGLTLAQQNAVDLLATGKNDTETATALNVNRVTVTRWRLYSPEFRAALAEQRAAIWGASADRLRSLLPKALDTLAKTLENPDSADRVAVALAVLKLAGPIPLPPSEPTNPDDILKREVDRDRERIRKSQTNTFDHLHGLPEYPHHREAIRKRLAALAPADEGKMSN